MRISSSTDRLEARFGALAAIRMNCEAGFEAIDYTMYTSKQAVFERGGALITREMKKTADSYGVVFNQAHAPFTRYKPGAENADYNRNIFRAVVRAIEVAGELAAPAIVVHPAYICPHITRDERFEMNMEVYTKLLPYAKAAGVKLAIENMWGRHKDCRDRIVKDICSDADELNRYIDGMGSPYVTGCLDVGHAGLVGESADKMVYAMGADRLTMLHIHDNDFFSDEHTLPFMGKINFPAILKALARIGYKGDMTLEADMFLEKLPDGLLPAGLKFMRSTAAYLRDEFLRASSEL